MNAGFIAVLYLVAIWLKQCYCYSNICSNLYNMLTLYHIYHMMSDTDKDICYKIYYYYTPF